ncbi:MAG: hypothetical protein WC822_06155 [Candidatus Paceibacterota bacterium]|jgi:hypothetical protein
MFLEKREMKQYRTGNWRVYLVNATYIRKRWDTNFTMGGHHYVYPWIPEYEVWIADELPPYERKMTVLHEFTEIIPMSQGIKYEDAHHHYANKAEGKARHGGDLDKMLENVMQRVANANGEASHLNGHIHHKIHGNPEYHAHKRRTQYTEVSRIS